MLLIYVMDFFFFFFLLFPSLSHIVSNQSFFFFLSLPACLACWLACSVSVPVYEFFPPHSLFLSMRFLFLYTENKEKKTDEIFSMFLHDSMFSSFLPFCVLFSALLLLLLLLLLLSSSCILFCTPLCHVAFYIFLLGLLEEK